VSFRAVTVTTTCDRGSSTSVVRSALQVPTIKLSVRSSPCVDASKMCALAEHPARSIPKSATPAHLVALERDMT
jgi:hypothetical protein